VGTYPRVSVKYIGIRYVSNTGTSPFWSIRASYAYTQPQALFSAPCISCIYMFLKIFDSNFYWCTL